MLIGSVANGLNSSGGFCVGSRIVVDRQRINGTSFVFSTAVPDPGGSSQSPPRWASRLSNMPSILSTLQKNAHAIRAALKPVDALSILSHAAYRSFSSIYLRSETPLSARPRRL